ncbi:MAG: hypothetical protein ABSB23_11735 [Bryobacteraceae bacterium]|jgi:hypothetical protein
MDGGELGRSPGGESISMQRETESTCVLIERSAQYRGKQGLEALDHRRHSQRVLPTISEESGFHTLPFHGV